MEEGDTDLIGRASSPPGGGCGSASCRDVSGMLVERMKAVLLENFNLKLQLSRALPSPGAGASGSGSGSPVLKEKEKEKKGILETMFSPFYSSPDKQDKHDKKKIAVAEAAQVQSRGSIGNIRDRDRDMEREVESRRMQVMEHHQQQLQSTSVNNVNNVNIADADTSIANMHIDGFDGSGPASGVVDGMNRSNPGDGLSLSIQTTDYSSPNAMNTNTAAQQSNNNTNNDNNIHNNNNKMLLASQSPLRSPQHNNGQQLRSPVHSPSHSVRSQKKGFSDNMSTADYALLYGLGNSSVKR